MLSAITRGTVLAFSLAVSGGILLPAQTATAPSTQASPAKIIPDQKKQAEANSDYRYASDLYQQGKYADALSPSKTAYEALPENALTVELYGSLLLFSSPGDADPEHRKAHKLEARKLLLHAQELGDNSPLVTSLLELLPADGSEKPFSSKSEVDAAMQEGEKLFSNGDLDGAIKSYMRAHLLDPTLYTAPLFIGDVYFRKKMWGSAGEWFKTAISINPDLETAYRYWGDAISSSGDMTAAREKYIDAWIASPYSQTTRNAGLQWAQRAGVKLSFPNLVSPNKVEQKDAKTTNLMIASFDDKAEDGRSAWMGYDIAKLAWKTETGMKEHFPDGKYKHTVAEEVSAYKAVEAIVQGLKPKEKTNLDPALKTLLELDAKDLVAAYVLIARPDNDIAQEYVAYRKEHRDKLKRFLDEYVFPKLSQSDVAGQ